MSTHLVAAYLRRLESLANFNRECAAKCVTHEGSAHMNGLADGLDVARRIAAEHFGPVVREEPGA
jgi:hypothetical protein